MTISKTKLQTATPLPHTRVSFFNRTGARSDGFPVISTEALAPVLGMWGWVVGLGFSPAAA